MEARKQVLARSEPQHITQSFRPQVTRIAGRARIVSAHNVFAGVALLLNLAGCAQQPDQPAGSQALLEQYPDEAKVAHQLFGRPCANELATLQVVHTQSEREAQALCETDEIIDGCTVVNLYPLPTIVLNDEARSVQRATVTHELMHFLLICSGKDTTGDPHHSRPTIWGLNGMLSAVNTDIFDLQR
jgi:hypothetical protein